jgi:hypothetical protein
MTVVSAGAGGNNGINEMAKWLAKMSGVMSAVGARLPFCSIHRYRRNLDIYFNEVNEKLCRLI